MKTSKVKWLIGTSLLLGAVTATAVNSNAEDISASINTDINSTVKTVSEEKVETSYSGIDSKVMEKSEVSQSRNVKPEADVKDENSGEKQKDTDSPENADSELKDTKDLKVKESNNQSIELKNDKTDSEKENAAEPEDTSMERARRDVSIAKKDGAKVGFYFSNEAEDKNLGFSAENPYEINATQNETQKLTLNLGVNSNGVDKKYAPGQINIYLPKSIFKDWEGGDKVNFDGRYSKMEYIDQYSSILKAGEELKSKDFKYDIVNKNGQDMLHLYNYREFTNKVFQLGVDYSFIPSLTQSSDEGVVFENNIYYDIEGEEDTVPLYVKLKTNYNKLEGETGVHKYESYDDVEIYEEWQDKWGKNPDTESDNYYYIVWYLDVWRASHRNNQNTRPFDYEIIDNSNDGTILGVKKVNNGDDSTQYDDFSFAYRFFERDFNSDRIVEKDLRKRSEDNVGNVVIKNEVGIDEKFPSREEINKKIAETNRGEYYVCSVESTKNGLEYNSDYSRVRYLILKKYDKKKIDEYSKAHGERGYILEGDFKINVDVKNSPGYTVDVKKSVAFRHKTLGPVIIRKRDPERDSDNNTNTDEYTLKGAIEVFNGKMRPKIIERDGKYYVVQKDGVEREITKAQRDAYGNEIKLSNGVYGFKTNATILNKDVEEKEIVIEEGKYYYQIINNRRIRNSGEKPQLDLGTVDVLNPKQFISGSDDGTGSKITIQKGDKAYEYEALPEAIELKEGDIEYRNLYITYDEVDGKKYDSGAVVLGDKNTNYATLEEIENANGDYSNFDYKPVEIYIKLKGGDYEEFGKVFRVRGGYGDGKYVFRAVEKYKDFSNDDLMFNKTDYVNRPDSRQIFLPDNVVGLKFKHKSSHMKTDINIYTTPVLKRTERVEEMVGKASSEKTPYIYTDSKMIYDGEVKLSEDVVSKSAYSLMEASKGSYFHISTNTSYNNAEKSAIVVDKTSGNEYAEVYSVIENSFDLKPYQAPLGDEGLDYQEMMREIIHIDNGTFYVLLPKGTSVKPGSVKMYDGRSMNINIFKDAELDRRSMERDKERKENEIGRENYNVEYETNWKNTGRTMMKVTYEHKKKFDKYGREPEWNTRNDVSAIFLRYILEKPFSMINMYGTDSKIDSMFITNTDENFLRGGEKFNNSNDSVSNGFKEIFEEEKSENESIKFCIRDSNIIFIDPKISQTGLSEVTVSADETTATVIGEEKNVSAVKAGDDYKYRVEFTPDANAQSSEIVFFSDLSKKKNSYKVKDKIEDTEWKGNFESVDISSITTINNSLKGHEDGFAAPKVYYGYSSEVNDDEISADVKADIESARGLFTEKVTENYFWSDKKIEGREVEAIIVDIRKDTNGENFLLSSSGGKAKKTLSFNINMTAPNKYPDNITLNKKASGNEVFISRRQSAMDAEGGDVECNGSATNIMYVSEGKHILKYHVEGDEKYGKPVDNDSSVVDKNIGLPDGIGSRDESGNIKDGFADSTNINVSGDLYYNRDKVSTVVIKESEEEGAKTKTVKGKWVFSGWNYDEKLKHKISSSDGAYSDITWNKYNDDIRDINNNIAADADKIKIEADTINLYGKWKFIPEKYEVKYYVNVDGSYKPVSSDGKTIGDENNDVNIVVSGTPDGDRKIPVDGNEYSNSDSVTVSGNITSDAENIMAHKDDTYYFGQWKFDGWYFDKNYSENKKAGENTNWNDYEKLAKESDIELPEEGKEGHNTIKLYGKWSFVPKYQVSYSIKGDPVYNTPELKIDLKSNKDDPLYSLGDALLEKPSEGADSTVNYLKALDAVRTQLEGITSADLANGSGKGINGHWYITGWYLGDKKVSEDDLKKIDSLEALNSLFGNDGKPESMVEGKLVKEKLDEDGNNYMRLPVYAQVKFIPEKYNVIYDVQIKGDYKPVSIDKNVVGDESNELKIVASGKTSGEDKVPVDSSSYKNIDEIEVSDAISPHTQEVQGHSGEIYYHGNWKFEGWYYDHEYSFKADNKFTWDKYKEIAQQKGIALPAEGEEGHNTAKLYGKWTFTPKYQLSYKINPDPVFNLPIDSETGKVIEIPELTPQISDKAYEKGYVFVDEEGKPDYSLTIDSLRKKLENITKGTKDGRIINGRWIISEWHVGEEVDADDLNKMNSNDGFIGKDNDKFESEIEEEFKNLFNDKPVLEKMDGKLIPVETEEKKYMRLPVYAQIKFIPKKYTVNFDMGTSGGSQGGETGSSGNKVTVNVTNSDYGDINVEVTKPEDVDKKPSDNGLVQPNALLDKSVEVEAVKDNVYTKGDLIFEGWYYKVKDETGKTVEKEFKFGKDMDLGDFDKYSKESDLEKIKVYPKWNFKPKYEAVYKVYTDENGYSLPDKIKSLEDDNADKKFEVVKDDGNKVVFVREDGFKDVEEGSKDVEEGSKDVEYYYKDNTGDLVGEDYVDGGFNGALNGLFDDGVYIYNNGNEKILTADGKIDTSKLGYVDVNNDGKTIRKYGVWQLVDKKWVAEKNADETLNSAAAEAEHETPMKRVRRSLVGFMQLFAAPEAGASKTDIEKYLKILEKGGRKYRYVVFEKQLKFIPYYSVTYKVNGDSEYSIPASSGSEDKDSAKEFNELVKDIEANKSTDEKFKVDDRLSLKDSTSVEKLKELLKDITVAETKDGSKVSGNWYITGWYLGNTKIDEEELKKVASEDDLNKLIEKIIADKNIKFIDEKNIDENMKNPDTDKDSFVEVAVEGEKIGENRLPLSIQLKFVPSRYSSGGGGGGGLFTADAEEKPVDKDKTETTEGKTEDNAEKPENKEDNASAKPEETDNRVNTGKNNVVAGKRSEGGKHAERADGDDPNKLPKTGTKDNSILTTISGLFVSLAGVVLLRKKKEEK